MQNSNVTHKGLGQLTQAELIEMSKKTGVSLTADQFCKLDVTDSDTDEQVMDKVRNVSMPAASK